MGDLPRWSRLLASSAVLAVLTLAVAGGLSRPAVEAAGAAARRPAAYTTSTSTQYAEPAAGSILAPFSVRTAVASRGDLAYASTGSGLTLADIPAAALSAYQRAATAIDLADARCHLDWELLAAIGKVASDHARANGSALDANGVARPAVLGPRLTGRHGTQRVTDTDGGVLDGETGVDRAVGPMMLLPATWSAVSVDGDSDGRRDPQDVDDAALGVAVYLCAGPGDLRRRARASEKVRGYHPGKEYARTVLAVRAAYEAAGSVPAATVLLARDSTAVAAEVAATLPVEPTETAGETFQTGASPSATPHGVPPSPTEGPTSAADPQPSASAGPSAPPTSDPSPTGSPDPSCSPTASPTVDPSASSEPSPTETPTLPGAPDATCPPDGTGDPSDGPSVGPTGAAMVVPGAALLWWRRRCATSHG